MPVNWAFPAAQGKPESFLAILFNCCANFYWLHAQEALHSIAA
jgi:hypothetical protein